jgi:hypothetical protein
MIGAKKLSTIRKEIEQAFAAPGEDPIQRLDRQIASAKCGGESTEVMEGLKRFLESPRKRERCKPRLKQESKYSRSAVAFDNSECHSEQRSHWHSYPLMSPLAFCRPVG